MTRGRADLCTKLSKRLNAISDSRDSFLKSVFFFVFPRNRVALNTSSKQKSAKVLVVQIPGCCNKLNTKNTREFYE